jgi:hypothetical protein
MADLLDYQIVRGSNLSVTVPRYTVSGRIVDSGNQANVRQDFTGANALVFPTVLASLTAAELDEFITMMMNWILRKRFPAAFS